MGKKRHGRKNTKTSRMRGVARAPGFRGRPSVAGPGGVEMPPRRVSLPSAGGFSGSRLVPENLVGRGEVPPRGRGLARLRGHGVEKFLGVAVGRVFAKHGFQMLPGLVVAAQIDEASGQRHAHGLFFLTGFKRRFEIGERGIHAFRLIRLAPWLPFSMWTSPMPHRALSVSSTAAAFW